MWHIGPKHVLKLNHVRSRRDVIKVKRSNSIDVLEDPRKLPGHSLNLHLTEAQASQSGDMKYLLPIDHAADSRGAGRGWSVLCFFGVHPAAPAGSDPPKKLSGTP